MVLFFKLVSSFSSQKKDEDEITESLELIKNNFTVPIFFSEYQYTEMLFTQIPTGNIVATVDKCT